MIKSYSPIIAGIRDRKYDLWSEGGDKRAKILVVYSSVGGNTKQLAEAVVKGVAEVEGSVGLLKEASDVVPDDLISANGIIAGSPVYFGSMSAEL